MIGMNINQIARRVNAADLTGASAGSLEKLVEIEKKLRKEASAISKHFRYLNS